MMARNAFSFRLGAEEYGIDILAVREIRAFERPTRIASAPAFILGVINLRGVIVPIVDLRIKFGVGEAAYDGTTVVIILNVANRVLGIVVDSVSDVLPLKDEEIRPAPEFSAAIEGLVRARARLGQRAPAHPDRHRDAHDEPGDGAGARGGLGV
jgi:purine-binding chemotaxis protein CheW